MTAERLPKFLRRRVHQLGLAAERRETPPRHCWCGRPVGPLSRCGCCCANHDADIEATARALDAAMNRHPAGKAKTDGGPSLREYLQSKGEL